MQSPSRNGTTPTRSRFANLVALSLATAALATLRGTSAFVVGPTAAASATSSLNANKLRCTATALRLLPSQASELVEAAAVKVYPPDSAESNDESYTSGEAAADASWLWDFQDDDHQASTATSAQGETVSPASSRLTRGLVARVFALPSSLIKRTRDPHIAVTKDDVVLFPVVGCRLVPEYSYREDVAADDIDVHDHLQIDNKDRDASAVPRKKKVVHVRSLPTVSNPSCRIRNFRDEELVGWYRKSTPDQQQGEENQS